MLFGPYGEWDVPENVPAVRKTPPIAPPAPIPPPTVVSGNFKECYICSIDFRHLRGDTIVRTQKEYVDAQNVLRSYVLCLCPDCYKTL